MSMSQSLDISALTGIGSVVGPAKVDDLAALAFLIFLSILHFSRGILWDKPDPYHHVWFQIPQSEDGGPRAASTRDIGVKLAESDKTIVIFWGSQSGTAEGLANRLARDCRRRFALDAISCDLSDFDPETIANIPASKVAIFIVSTYGEGDPSDNASQLMSWLESDHTVHFPNLRYAAFGLGNQNYRLYNRVIDVLVQGLHNLHATALLPTGKADDSKGTTEEDFTEWKQGLFSIFRTELNFEERQDEYNPSLKVVDDTSLDIIDLHLGEPVPHLCNVNATIAKSSPVYILPVKEARKLLTTANRNCLHIELDISEYPGLKYRTGDHLAIWPSNPTSEVERLLNILGLQDRKLTPLLVSSLDPSDKCKIPSPTTISSLFQYYLEICAPVGREMVLALAQVAPSPSVKAYLSQLSQDKEVYNDYCSKHHVTFGRILEAALQADTAADLTSWSYLPLSFVLESIPLLTPRYYSISSSAIIQPRRIAITMTTLTHNANLQPIPGLTTNYLLAHATNQPEIGYSLGGPNNVLQNGKVFAHIRPSKFRLPVVSSVPIIMVAAGSGIAPFRAFIAERSRLTALGKVVGKTILFFGCRSPVEDFIYQDELEEICKSSKGNIEIVTAFSRTDVNRKGGKMYVQDRVEERGDGVLRLLVEEDASFYVCGSATMAREVGVRIRALMTGRLDWNEERVKEWWERARKKRRWQEDVWG